MNKTTFQDACVVLWGPQYQAEAARQLGVSRSSVVRYDSGQREVPEELLHKLYGMLIKRRAEIDKLAVRMRGQSVTWSRLAGTKGGAP